MSARTRTTRSSRWASDSTTDEVVAVEAGRRRIGAVIAAAALAAVAGCGTPGGSAGEPAAAPAAPEPYQPTWESLAAHDAAPAWFREAKFGIYAHWGVLSVPAFGNDWYPRNMHVAGTDEHRHQVETYGPLERFGYHDFVPRFTAERYDPEEWADLFHRAGARFAGMVAEHHDGFSMWDSAVNPWNAGDRGPRRDVLGALERAVRGRGMRFVTSFHMARNLQLYQDRPEAQTDSSYFPWVQGWATASTDPELRILYGNLPPERFFENWEAKLAEVVDRYAPDLIYFDGLLVKIPEAYKLRFLARTFNRAAERGADPVITYKDDEIPSTIGVPDYEKGRVDHLAPEPWLTDETISTGSWSHVEGLEYRPVHEILHILADVVSKNGTLMLNVSPRADGSLPVEQREILLEIGEWLRTHGEAIYGTRPWLVYGEGPTVMRRSGAFAPRVEYRPEDIRYTSAGNRVYAIALGWPGPGRELVLSAFAEARAAGTRVLDVSILGAPEAVAWERRTDGLAITTPSTPPSRHAVVFRIRTAGRAGAPRRRGPGTGSSRITKWNREKR